MQKAGARQGLHQFKSNQSDLMLTNRDQSRWKRPSHHLYISKPVLNADFSQSWSVFGPSVLHRLPFRPHFLASRKMSSRFPRVSALRHAISFQSSCRLPAQLSSGDLPKPLAHCFTPNVSEILLAAQPKPISWGRCLSPSGRPSVDTH